MRTSRVAFVIAGAVAGLVGLAASQTPPGHPPLSPSLPPGHPPLTTRPAAADPADVATPQAVVAAYYETVSGPAGAPRDWDRFRSLFAAEARLAVSRPGQPGGAPLMLDPQRFIAANRTYFERGGYFERQVDAEVRTFGAIAHVFSTFESRRRAEAPEPYAGGVNSFQLLHSGDRWWIVSVIWDHLGH